MEKRKLDVLAIAAHRDDIEITCGGTLLRLADRDKKVGVLDLTEGEMGTRGTAADRERESIEAARILGLAWRGNLGLPDAGVEVTTAYKIKIAQVICKFHPELVILPFWQQRHPDHLAACRLGYDACFLAGLEKLELPGGAHRPRKIIYASSFREVKHSFFVDITDQMERKLESVRAYRSQFDGTPESKRIFKPGVDIFEYMEITARHYGHLVGVRYAEAFAIRESILVDDPTEMPVRSI